MDEETARAWAILLGALGVGGFVTSGARSLWKWWSGRSGRERARNNDLLDRALSAEEARDVADSLRRRALEYASLMRRQLTEAGITPQPWPEGLSARSHRAPKKEKP